MAYSRSSPSMFRRCLFDTLDYPSILWNQDFGTGLLDNDLYPPMAYHGDAIRPRTLGAGQFYGQSEVKNEKDTFQVMMNVSHFKPCELKAKLVDNYIVVHGKHEEKSDGHGFIRREFTRRYLLPEEAETESVKCSLSVDGVLTIEAAKKVMEPLSSNERNIPIVMSSCDSAEENK